MKRVLKNILSQLHSFALWALMSVLLWGWIFGLATDTSYDKKVMIYCHVPELRDVELTMALEDDLPESIKMVQVHSFDYVMFDTVSIAQADILIIPAVDVSEMRDEIVPLEGDGGAEAYDPDTGEGILLDYITYGDEAYYLFLGAGSAHLEDGIAARIAKKLLDM